MTASSQLITSEMVTNPRHSRLSMLVRDGAVDVVVTSNVEDNSLLWKHIPLDSDAPSVVKAVEDVIYNNPVLLNEFASVHILIDTPRYLVIPPSQASPAAVESMFADLYGDDALEIVPAEVGAGVVLAMAVDRSLTSFFRRTFHNASISHRLAPVVKYFGVRNKLGNAGKFHVLLGDDTVDIVAFGADGLLMANTFQASRNDDALYYILTAARHLCFDNSTDQMFLSGSPARRELLLPELRKYINYAMPAIFPSAMFRAGKEALSAPFELIALPLCE